eukprot:gene8500-9196_t
MTKNFSDIFELIRNKIHQLTFCNHKKIDLPFDSIEVEGIGKISIPISLNEIERLKTRATQAPFGRGFETLVDREVRDVLQIDGSQLLLQENVLAEIIKDLLGEMNIEVDALPVEGGYEGGSLVVSHEGEEKEVVFDKESEKQAYAVAFYADCEHELKEQPYSMMIEKKSLPYVMSALSEMEGYLKGWKERVKDNTEESVFHAMPLAHKYTEQNLSFMGSVGSVRPVGMVGAVMTMMRNKKARAKAMKKKPPKMKVVPNPNQLLPALLSLLKKGSSEIKDEIDSLSSTCDSNEGVKEMAYPEDE